jgi:hypothetical protein
MKTILILTLSSICSLCIAQEAKIPDLTNIDTAKFKITLSPKGLYNSRKVMILSRKSEIAARYGKGHNKDSLYAVSKAALEAFIINGLIPFWYGTPWDFNGHTSVPGRGVVSCGYFVSTVLLHCGFNLNRYTLAQQNPMLEALTVQINDSIQTYQMDFDLFSQTFRKKNEEGLYFVGLDFHVGFLLHRAGELLFIHSSYLDPLCVVIEYAASSAAFNASTTYTVAQLSNNKNLIDRWISGAPIKTRTK